MNCGIVEACLRGLTKNRKGWGGTASDDGTGHGTRLAGAARTITERYPPPRPTLGGLLCPTNGWPPPGTLKQQQGGSEQRGSGERFPVRGSAAKCRWPTIASSASKGLCLYRVETDALMAGYGAGNTSDYTRAWRLYGTRATQRGGGNRVGCAALCCTREAKREARVMPSWYTIMPPLLYPVA